MLYYTVTFEIILELNSAQSSPVPTLHEPRLGGDQYFDIIYQFDQSLIQSVQGT